MITVTSLSTRYGSTVAVDDVTFDCEPGTITGFLGPNGAGKSTALRMITGLTRPTSGTATVTGRRAMAGSVQCIRAVGVLRLHAPAADPTSVGFWIVLPLAVGVLASLRREVK